MPHRTVTVGSASGLHARPAALFSKAAAEAGVPVVIGKPGGDPVDAASLLSVMALGVGHGDQVVLASPDEAAGDVLDKLAELLKTDLDA